MHNPSLRERTMHSLPDHYGAQLPSARLGHLHPNPIAAVLVAAHRLRSDSHDVARSSAGLELTGWRQAHALGVGLAPRLFPKGVRPGRCAHFGALPFEPHLVGEAKTTTRAEPRPTLMRRPVTEGFSAVLTWLFHNPILPVAGLLTVPLTDYFRDGVAYLQAEEAKVTMPALPDLDVPA